MNSGGCEGASGPQTVGRCRFPWRHKVWANWSKITAVGAYSPLITLDGWSTALDLTINPNGNIFDLGGLNPSPYVIQVFGHVPGVRVPITSLVLGNDGVVPPFRFIARACVRKWEVGLFIQAAGAAPMPQAGAAGKPILSAIAYGSEAP